MNLKYCGILILLSNALYSMPPAAQPAASNTAAGATAATAANTSSILDAIAKNKADHEKFMKKCEATSQSWQEAMKLSDATIQAYYEDKKQVNVAAAALINFLGNAEAEKTKPVMFRFDTNTRIVNNVTTETSTLTDETNNKSVRKVFSYNVKAGWFKPTVFITFYPYNIVRSQSDDLLIEFDSFQKQYEISCKLYPAMKGLDWSFKCLRVPQPANQH